MKKGETMPGKYDPYNPITPINERNPSKPLSVKPFQVMTDEEWWQTDLYKKSRDSRLKNRQSIIKKDEKPDSLS